MAVEAGSELVPENEDGSRVNPRRWVRIYEGACDQILFGDFINQILTDIEQNPAPNNVDTQRVIMWDNLSVHKTAYVSHILHDRPTNNHFFSIDCPPYCPRLAPIEYIFCELASELSQRCKEDWTSDTLRVQIQNICARLGRAQNMSLKCL